MKKLKILPVLILLGFLLVSLADISLAIEVDGGNPPKPQSSWPSGWNLIIGLVILSVFIFAFIRISRTSKESQKEISEDKTFDYCPGER